MKKIIAFVSSALFVFALAAVAYVPVARAHAEIESCIPAIDSTVETAPDKLVCTASQGMEPKGSSLSVFDANGAPVDKGDSAVDLNDPDRKTISVSLDTAKMKEGVYMVKWTTVSADDGDEDSGEFKFTVGHAHTEQPTPAATPTGESHSEGGTHHDDHSIASGTVDGKEVKLQIIAPAKDTPLPAGDVKIEAKVEGITLGENDTHLHFYVDEKLADMGEGAQSSFTVKLDAGKHDLEVGLAQGENEDALKAHVHVTVEGAAATASATSNTLPATGGAVNYALFGLLAVLGVMLFGAGAFVFVRARH